MPTSAEALAIVAALLEPALLATPIGHVFHANRAALRMLGRSIIGGNLVSLCQDPEPLRTLLKRASGSVEALPGSLLLPLETGLSRLRLHASLVRPARTGEPALILVRLTPFEDQRFASLTQKIGELNGEIRRRQRIQAVLEESLQERNLLLRELHHRVKNNMQMLASMLMGAQREAASEEVRAILQDAAQRLAAVGTVQQMLYGSESLSDVRTDEFLPAITTTIMQASGQNTLPRITADAGQLPNDLAVPVALILNELVSNALKYGRPDQEEPAIAVTLRIRGEDYVLTVEDNGPGFDLVDTRKRASGLGLVRGLVRQLGGSLAVERSGGARIKVMFRNRTRPAETYVPAC